MTLRLHQTFGAHTGRSFSFDQDVIRVGRMPDSDVAFDPHADLDASGRHAEIRREGGKWVVTDKGSRNGTLVNGQLVQHHTLADGDELEFGPGGPRLRVELTELGTSGPGAPTAPARPNAATQAATPLPAPGAATGPMTGLPQTTPPPPPHGGPVAPTPKRYGERTVGLMIRDALTKANDSKGLKIAVGFLSVLLLGALGVLGWVVFGSPGGGAAPDPAHVTAANAGALFRLVETQAGSTERTLCTAFAVRRNVLATTARCVLIIESRRAAGSQVDVRGVTGAAPVQRLWRHPGFVEGTEGPDVGLLEIGGSAATLVTLATLDRLHRVRDGDELLAYGFSGEVARTVPIEVVDARGDAYARRFGHTAGSPVGSPVFDASGAVVGIHSSGVGGAEPSPEGPGFVVGADALLALLAGMQTP